MQDRSDEELMTAYARGDTGAFERLYRRHRGPLYRYILKQVGDAATANDLYQGSWEKIIRARKRYRASSPFRAWMYRVARNHVIDHFRRVRPTAELRPEAIEAPNPGPDEGLAEWQQAQRLGAAIEALPAEQKEALLLRLEGGLDLHSIARVTGVGPETAKSRLRYAVARLKVAVAGVDDGANA